MCGIAGWVGRPPERPLGERIARMSHRGPDSQGLWEPAGQPVGLGHHRLAILDLSPAGHQPMRAEGLPLTIVFNGEIYNYPELRRELELEGASFMSHTDTEVLLHLYARHGASMLDRLNGIFALAIWDERDRTLFCARDPLGTKPFYWACAQGTFHFASEAKVFLGEPGLEPALDLEALGHYLTFLWAASPRSPFQGVKKLEPGHWMRIDAQGGTAGSTSYFRWHYDEEPGKTPEAWAGMVREEVNASVRRQLLSDVPVGLFLSGGLDSSSIAAAFRRAAPETPIHAFCSAAGTGDGFEEDLPYAERVARAFGLDLHVVHSPRPELDRWSDILWHLEEPQADPAIQHVDSICRMSKEMGLKVLLSGAGGDDLFSGYRRHQMAAQEVWMARIPLAIRRGLAKVGRRLPQGMPALRRAAKALTALEYSSKERMASLFEWLSPDLVAGLCQSPPSKSPRTTLLEALEDLDAGTSPIHQALYLETRGFLPDHNLNYTDKLGMAHGVEVRVPLLDMELVKLAQRMPPQVKLRGGSLKWVLKASQRGILPAEIIDRPKTGFGAPLRTWMLGPMKAEMEALLDQVCTRRPEWFVPDRVRRLWEDTQARRVDGAYALWTVATVGLWADRFKVR